MTIPEVSNNMKDVSLTDVIFNPNIKLEKKVRDINAARDELELLNIATKINAQISSLWESLRSSDPTLISGHNYWCQSKAALEAYNHLQLAIINRLADKWTTTLRDILDSGLELEYRLELLSEINDIDEMKKILDHIDQEIDYQRYNEKGKHNPRTKGWNKAVEKVKELKVLKEEVEKTLWIESVKDDIKKNLEDAMVA